MAILFMASVFIAHLPLEEFRWLAGPACINHHDLVLVDQEPYSDHRASQELGLVTGGALLLVCSVRAHLRS